ncbi:hypothetical protein N356_gp109 [Cellulophaga phage phi14:2]|uniref:Uncharacterized protein n=1 Tax=Cellulophaga phage phi14:2 TaxID=1327990 RepID=S0A2H6_9CAUD|nr:hypothetical protein N356_gp109 [Cellulophaga phage phi14:2]AGO49005.1 hypothetical protein Phi14:2_gp127 [Cellulophaga phage phi14:2]
MAITVNTLAQTNEQVEFPKLMISDMGRIILATKISNKGFIVGTCILNPRMETDTVQGQYSEGWDATAFKDYDGAIELFNKTPQ